MSFAADRNLLFGVLVFQLDLVSKDEFVTAMNACLIDKNKTLGQILVEMGALSKHDHDLIEPMVSVHIANHGGDAVNGLKALSSIERIAKEFSGIPDPELREVLDRLGITQVPLLDGGNIKLQSDLPADEEAAPEKPRKQRPEGGWKAGRFRVITELAGGGMGKVYEAWDDDELGRRVALKMIREDRAPNEDTRRLWEAKLRREGEIIGNLEHPNIIPIYGLGTTDNGRPFYAMRFLYPPNLHDVIVNFHAGRPLFEKTVQPAQAKDQAAANSQETRTTPAAVRFDRLSGDRNLDFRTLLERFTAICRAIEYAHRRRVLHRDLKPGNVMIGEHGEALVIDWGLAKTGADVQAESRG